MGRSSNLLQGLHLLVIEDENETSELLTVILQLEGAEVTAVVHIDSALKVLERFRPDVILSNIHLPDGDGYLLLSLWRDKEAELGIAAVPAIIITESERGIPKKRIQQAGFETYIARPFDVDRIAEIVASTVQARD